MLKRRSDHLLFLVLVLLCSVWIGPASTQAQPILPTAGEWTSTGPGTHSVTDAVYGITFSYDMNDTSVWDGQSWEVSTTASDDTEIYYQWHYSGLHAWFMAEASLTAFVVRGGVVTMTEPLFDKSVFGGFEASGTSSFTVQAGDRFGFIVTGINFDSNSLLGGTLDILTSPLIEADISGTMGHNGWYVSDVQLNWILTDPASGVMTSNGCGPVSITADTSVTGMKYSCSAESAGGQSTKEVTIKRDASPPMTTDDAPYEPAETDVTVQLIASDESSGVAATYYTVNGGPNRTGTSVTLTSDGMHTLVYWSVDHAGNVEPQHVKTIKISKGELPLVAFDPDREQPTNQDVVLTLAYPPEAVNKEYSLNGQTWLTYDAPLIVSDNGTIYARYQNDLGKWSAVSQYTIDNIDREAPAGNLTINDGAEMTAGDTVTLSIDDENTGAAEMQFSHDGTAWSEWEAYNAAKTFVLPPGDGEKRVYARLKDAAGNESAPFYASILLDLPPIITLAPYDSTTPTNQDITVYAFANEGTLNAVSYTFTENGSFEFAAADAAGNVTTAAVTIANIDKEAPITVLRLSEDPVTKHVTAELDAADGGSGITDSYVTIDGVTYAGSRFELRRQGEHLVTYWSVDAAGNIEAANSRVVRVDILQLDPDGHIAIDAIIRLISQGEQHAKDMNGDQVFDQQDLRIMLAYIAS